MSRLFDSLGQPVRVGLACDGFLGRNVQQQLFHAIAELLHLENVQKRTSEYRSVNKRTEEMPVLQIDHSKECCDKDRFTPVYFVTASIPRKRVTRRREGLMICCQSPLSSWWKFSEIVSDG